MLPSRPRVVGLRDVGMHDMWDQMTGLKDGIDIKRYEVHTFISVLDAIKS